MTQNQNDSGHLSYRPVLITEEPEDFCATMNLRWLVLEREGQEQQTVLLQGWVGSQGTVKWREVETVRVASLEEFNRVKDKGDLW